MKPESKEIAQAIIQSAADNPKVNGSIGVLVAFLGGISADQVALYLGITLTSVCIYNQIMVAIKASRELKKTKK